VKDIMAGTDTSYPHELTAGGDVLFFAADDDQHGQELWTSRGSVAGTDMLIDIKAGPLGSLPTALTFVPFA
jgi:ELWxxDGT repeat protein